MNDVAIIGAGPYGLSIAAHLQAAGTKFRIFGTPMQTWRTQMPRGMHMKSEGFASTLYDPHGSYRLKHYCNDNAIAYADIGLPVSVETFSSYGETFQKRFVPMLEQRQVTGLTREGEGFGLTLDDGEHARFRRVVCAIGISHYAFTPPELSALPPEAMSHSSRHADLSVFAGRSVLVVGGGASAADCAALLHAAGARPAIVARRAQLSFHAPPRRRSLADRVRAPFTTIGPGWRSVLATQAPLVFHAMPERFRLRVTRNHLGPAPCWFIRERIEGHVPVHCDMRIRAARMQAGKPVLDLDGPSGPLSLSADHVVAATGYRVDLDRLAFLDPALRRDIQAVEATPILSRWFESSVPGLFFVGASSANAFGPLVRFACGASFTARRLRGALAA